MKYKVLEDFPLDVGKPDPVQVAAGSEFIPAASNVPLHTVEELVRTRKIELIRPPVPDAAKAKRK